jgi:hypothetical protein
MSHGVKLVCHACTLCLLVILAGCQRHILINLLNSSGASIQVVDYNYGRITKTVIANNSRLLVLSPVPLVIKISGKEQEYFIRVPSEFLQSEFRGRIAYLELGGDDKMYLLRINEKSATTRVDPQPIPFPIAPN